MVTISDIEFALEVTAVGTGAAIPFLPDTTVGSPRTIAMAIAAVSLAVAGLINRHLGKPSPVI
jgi:ABC-type enterochelin transport system permease subunit